jgi:hypothetical protein
VRKKVVVFFGMPEGSANPAGMTVKLAASQPLALAQPGVEPSLVESETLHRPR